MSSVTKPIILDETGQAILAAINNLPKSVIEETVAGATPSITGVDNHRYLCGTVTDISITPPQTGIISVLFTAGSGCELTLPNTVQLPEGFDSETLTEGTVYEINIADGIYGVVASWT